jgi:hypothetical protein
MCNQHPPLQLSFYLRDVIPEELLKVEKQSSQLFPNETASIYSLLTNVDQKESEFVILIKCWGDTWGWRVVVD